MATVAIDFGLAIGVTIFALYMIGGLVFFVIIPLRVIFSMKRKRQTQSDVLSAAARALGAKVGTVTIPARVHDTIGFKVVDAGDTVFAFGSNRRHQHYVEILLQATGNRPNVVVRRSRSGWMEDVARAVGLSLNLGFHDFERRVWFDCDTGAEMLRKMLAPNDLRKAILRALESFESVNITSNAISVVGVAEEMQPETIPFVEIVGALRTIRSLLPELSGAELTTPRRRDSPVLPYIALPFVGTLVFFVMFAVWDRRWPLSSDGFSHGLAIGSLAWLVFIILIYIRIRFTSRRFGEFVLALWTTILAIPLVAAAVVWTLNAVLDSSPAIPVQAIVVKKSNSNSFRSGPRWVLNLKPSTGQALWERDVSRRLYESAKPGDTMIANVHSGAFGWAWGNWQQ